jgi:hypothetical protein
MAREPNERFSNVDELLRALLPYAEGHAPEARSHTLPTLQDDQPGQPSAKRAPSTPTPLFGESELGGSTVAVSSSAARWSFRVALVALAAFGVGLLWYGEVGRLTGNLGDSSDEHAAVAVSFPPPVMIKPAPLVDAGVPRVLPKAAEQVEPTETADVHAAIEAEPHNQALTDLTIAPSAPRQVLSVAPEPEQRAVTATAAPVPTTVTAAPSSPAPDGAAVAQSQTKEKTPPSVVPASSTTKAATRPVEPGTSEEPGVSVRQVAPAAAGDPARLRMRLQGEPALPEARHGRARPNVGLATDDFMVTGGEGARATSRPTPHMDSDDF